MPTNNFTQKLDKGMDAMGLPLLSSPIKENLAAYQKILSKWNSKINLTAHRSEESSLEKNFLDSLVLLPLVTIGNILDFGSGAGFPGLVLKICHPNISLTLVESDRRKSAFLSTMTRELALQDTQVVQFFLDKQKVEELGWAGCFEGIVSRATMEIDAFLPLASLCLKEGGRFFGMVRGDRVYLEKPVDLLIGLEREESYQLPFSKLQRKILIFKKTCPE